MKVVHLESGRHLYGGARQVDYLMTGLARRGIDNVLVCRPGAEIARTASGARVIQLPMHGDLDWPTIRRLRRVLRAERPACLHVHSRAGADLFGGLAARAEGIPAVVTRRVDNREPRVWARTKLARYDAIAAISSAVRNWLVDEIGLPCERVNSIASAVDGRGFAARGGARQTLARRYGIGPETPVIGVVGQLIRRKGHDVVLAAMPAVLARVPEARLLIFGRGPDERTLRLHSARHGLDRHVTLAGYDATLRELLAGFDLLVHPARREGLGVAVLEALSCGVPVVASRTGGLVDVIRDGRTGRAVAPDDPAALASAIVEMLLDPARRHALAERGRQYVHARHSVDAMTTAYLSLYRQCGASHAQSD